MNVINTIIAYTFLYCNSSTWPFIYNSVSDASANANAAFHLKSVVRIQKTTTPPRVRLPTSSTQSSESKMAAVATAEVLHNLL